jgi:hypothetical protein
MEIPDLQVMALLLGVSLDAVQHLNQLTDFRKFWYDSVTEVYPSLTVFNDL